MTGATPQGAEPPDPPGVGPGDEPVFGAPWQAQAFAMTLMLHERGLFTWAEWAQELAAQIRQAQGRGDPDVGDTYYQHWLAALEQLVQQKGASDAGELEHFRSAWALAAARTPHGQPIVLDSSPGTAAPASPRADAP